MSLVWRWSTVAGNEKWKGLTWGMLPLHASGVAACTYHFFYNDPSLQVSEETNFAVWRHERDNSAQIALAGATRDCEFSATSERIECSEDSHLMCYERVSLREMSGSKMCCEPPLSPSNTLISCSLSLACRRG